jgi:hypothetical protein
MLQKDAARLAGQLIHHIDFENAPEPQDRATHVVRDAIFTNARLFIPDNATGAVVAREGENGVLVATDGNALYTIEGLLPETEMSPGFARCRLIHLNRSRDTVEHTTGFRRPMGSVIRETHWHFRVADLEFEIETKFDEDDPCPEPEMLAERLANAMGWNYGGDARELKEAA